MPELPEVETVRRTLEGLALRGAVERVYRSRLDLRTGAHWRRSLERVRVLEGMAPGPLGRRGKYLLWTFLGSERQEVLLVHLGMSGRLAVHDRREPRPAHTHLELAIGSRAVRFVDPRRFGGLRVAPQATLLAEQPLSRLGPEPLEPGFDGTSLMEKAGRSKRILRDILLDQRVVAGVGNIYASEALFEARLHPLLAGDRLAPSAWQRLADAVIAVLERGIENRGTTLRDYRAADGSEGSNQHALWVYGRAGQPCRGCGATLIGYVHQGRAGVYCPKHQPKSRARWIR